MRRILVALTAFVAVLASMTPSLAATAKVGAKCTKAGATAKAGTTTLVCTKSGKKLVWAKKAAPAPAPTPTPTPTPTQTADTPQAIISAATDAFMAWAATARSNVDLTYKIGEGTPANLETWIRTAIPFISSRLPAFTMPNKYAAVVAADEASFNALMTDVYGAAIAEREKPAFGGAPAAAGNFFNIWNLRVISAQNLMAGDAVGMMQSSGHEYFHLLQNNVTGCGPCMGRPNEVPQWFWEGPAMFMGLQTARQMKFADYLTVLRKQMITRYLSGGITNTMLLKDVTVNDGKVDPYAIGFAATELLVSRIGMDKFINIYYEVGKGKTFADAFESQAGMSLNDFYTLFENSRAGLGFPKK